MARELGVSHEGDTRTVCMRAKAELDANLQVSIKTEKRLVTKYTPPVCKTDIDFTAGFVAECEAKASADVSVSCAGRCGGTCNGACDGTCSAGAAGAVQRPVQRHLPRCCTVQCEGYANVDASAECKASAEIRATTYTTCTPAKTEIVQQDVTVVDATKWNKAMAAINAGLPQLLTAGKKLELTGEGARAVGPDRRVARARRPASSPASLVRRAHASSVSSSVSSLRARTSRRALDVSIEVSASVSASAGATAQ